MTAAPLNPLALIPSSTAFWMSAVDREFDAVAFDRIVLAQLLDFTAKAVDDDGLVAFRPHQNLVERLFDASLPDDRAGIDALVIGLLELDVAHFADVAEQMRRHVASMDTVATALPAMMPGSSRRRAMTAATCGNDAFSIRTMGR